MHNPFLPQGLWLQRPIKTLRSGNFALTVEGTVKGALLNVKFILRPIVVLTNGNRYRTKTSAVYLIPNNLLKMVFR